MTYLEELFVDLLKAAKRVYGVFMVHAHEAFFTRYIPFYLREERSKLEQLWARNHWRSFAKFGLLQALYFIVAVANIRALAHLQYGWAVFTDGLFCLLTWTIVKNIGEAKDPYSRVGYVCGGMVGSLIGMWITHMWGG